MAAPLKDCEYCNGVGYCDHCDAIDGRWIEAVCEYASTCDVCGELTHHDLLTACEEGCQLGTCESCIGLGKFACVCPQEGATP